MSISLLCNRKEKYIHIYVYILREKKKRERNILIEMMLLGVRNRLILNSLGNQPKKILINVYQLNRLSTKNRNNGHDETNKTLGPEYGEITHSKLIERIKILPIKRTDESIAKMRSRLIYQSRKRGILETDLLLSSFASKYLKAMNLDELKEYDELLNELDWDIYYWATKNYKTSKIPDRWVNSRILQKLQDFAENRNKEILKMPDLDTY